MKRSNWVRLIAVILIISMLAAPVSAATSSGYDGVRTNGLVGFIVEIIRDIIRDIFDDWFDKPGDGEPVPTEPIETTAPTAPGESEPTEPGETEPTTPGETKPTTPGETKPTEPGETEPDEIEPSETEPEETEPTEEAPDYELNLIEGYENTTNGHLLRAETYSLSQVIAQQTKPLTTANANRFGTKLGNSLGGNTVSTGVKPMALKSSGAAVAPTSNTSDAEYGFRNWVNGGQYYIQNARADFNNANSWLRAENNAIVGTTRDNATLFTLSFLDNGKYTLSYDDNGTTKYLYLNTTLSDKGDMDGFSTTAQELTIEHLQTGTVTHNGSTILEDDGHFIRIGSNGKYLCQYGGTTVTTYGAEDSSGDSGNAMWFHQVENDTTTKVTYGLIEPVVDPSDDSRDIPVSVMTANAGNSQSGEGPTNALDNDDNTLWHTSWDGSDRSTHWIQFDLSEDYYYSVDGLRYLPRQGSGNGSQNGIITEYEIQVSDDGQTFIPVATGTWSYSDRSWKIATFDAVNARYVRLVVKDAQSDSTTKLYASAAEIRLTGEVYEDINPELPEGEGKVVYFPVTMFDYDTDAINTATHIKELSQDSAPEMWNGIYFSSGTPAGYNGPTGEYTDAWSVTYELVTPTLSNGAMTNLDTTSDYILVNKRSGRAVALGDCQRPGGLSSNKNNLHLVDSPDLGLGTNLTDAPARITMSYSAENADSSFVWNYYTDGTYRYFITEDSDAENRKFLDYTTSSSGTNTTSRNQNHLSFRAITSDAKAVLIQHGNSMYLSDHSGHSGDFYCGLGDTGDDGNPFYIYKKVSSEATQVPVTEDFTSIKYADYNYFRKGPDNTSNEASKYGDMFYTGMVKDMLNYENNPKGELEFADGITDGGIFSYDRSAISLANNYYDGVKNVYEFVGMPFVQTAVDGNVVYTFDSDQNGVYFRDIDGDLNNDPAPGTATKLNKLWIDYGNPQPLGFNVKDGSQNGWFPYNLYTDRTNDGVDNPSYGSNSDVKQNLEYHFGMRADLQFSMTTNGRIKETDDTSTPITFKFSGDDDVWIFIDGKLVADLGGLHNRFDIMLDFAANTVVYSEENDADTNGETSSYNDPDFSTTQKLFKTSDNDNALIDMTRNAFASSGNHTIQFFYLERGEGTSNCMIQFNLPMRDAILVTKEANKSWSAAQDAIDGDDHDGTLDLTPEEQSAVNAMNFGFTLYKAPGSCLDENGQPVVDDLSFEPVAATNYYVLNQDGIVIAIRSTNEQGRFYIRNNETAKFITDIPGTGMTYYVVEDDAPEGFLTPDYKYDGETTYDIAYYGFTMNQDDHNSSRKVFGTTDLPSKLGEHELPMNATENNSYYITGRGSIEATDTLEFICVNYLEQDDQPHAQEDTIVIDYGLPVQLDPMENDLIRGEFVEGIEIVAVKPGEHTFNITDGNTENEDQTDDLDVYIPAEGEFSLPELPVEGAPEQTIAGHSGTFTFENVDYTPAGDRMPVSRDRFTYTLNKQLTEVEVLSYLIAVNIYTNAEKTETKTEYTQAKVYIVPATIMYYEENFDGLVSYTGTGEKVGEQRNEDYVSEFQEPGVVGTIGDSTYGSDVAYLNDSYDSNGTSYKLDTTSGSVRFKYTFTGTGTTFFARTSANTAYMQVLIFNGDLTFEEAVAAASKKEQIDTYYRDTYYNDTNGYAQDESGTLYNIPVYTYDALQYGTYTVVVSIAKKGTKGAGPSYPSLDANGNPRYYLNEDGSLKLDDNGDPIPIYENRSEPLFYLDGIRIMQPLKEVVVAEAVEDEETGELISPTLYDALTTRAHNAYTTDGEAHLNVVTLRQKLLDEFDPNYDEESGEEEPNWPFAVLTDTNGNLVKHSEYETIGPKEEVYLAPEMPTEDGGVNAQKVTFSLKYWQPEGLKLYMGMKAPFGSATVKVGDREFDLYNATDCYYDVSENRTSLEVKYDQIFDDNGYPLFTDPDGRDVYKDDDGNYIYSEDGSAVLDDTELEPKFDLSTEHYVVTYSFESIESIVSLTNIKVVGSHEFIILEAPDVITPGDEDLNEEGTE